MHCRFALTAPRNFQYPAILLLLVEEPRHGYRLVDALLRLGFGAVDRSSVYRALADLEADGLVSAEAAPSSAGAGRNVYTVTEDGRRALDSWMEVMAEARDGLDRVLKRYTSL